MGTRNLTCIKKDGEYILAKYCQWDGYYEGQGRSIAHFLRKPGNIEWLRESCDCLSFISQDELDRYWIEAGAKPNTSWVSMEVANRFSHAHPELSRDNGGGEILKMICRSEWALKTINDLDFAADSLYCEFAYVIDFDENTFSWYEGFNKTPLKEGERFAFLNKKAREGYYPVREVGSVPLEADKMPEWKFSTEETD